MVLDTCETWVKQCCQEWSPSICHYNYDFPICHFIIKYENITLIKNRMWKYSNLHPLKTCVHMNSYGNGVKFYGSLDVGSQHPAKSEWGWHTNLHPILMLYFYPHLVNNEHSLTYHSLFNSIDWCSDTSIHLCSFQCK